jgi:hypothetical protein
MQDEYKPVLDLRREVAKDDVIILDPKRVARMHNKTLRTAEDYYSKVLEALCGKQVWSILDSLTAVQEEMKSRRAPVASDTDEQKEQVKRIVFAELDRNYKNGHRHRSA